MSVLLLRAVELLLLTLQHADEFAGRQATDERFAFAGLHVAEQEGHEPQERLVLLLQRAHLDIGNCIMKASCAHARLQQLQRPLQVKQIHRSV